MEEEEEEGTTTAVKDTRVMVAVEATAVAGEDRLGTMTAAHAGAGTAAVAAPAGIATRAMVPDVATETNE